MYFNIMEVEGRLTVSFKGTNKATRHGQYWNIGGYWVYTFINSTRDILEYFPISIVIFIVTTIFHIVAKIGDIFRASQNIN